MTLWRPPLPDFLMNFVLGHWPEGDEDAMRRVAGEWSAMANALKALQDPADQAMNTALAAVDGKINDAMSSYWQDVAGGDGSDLAQLITMCERYATQLEHGATDIEHAKLTIYISLAAMLAMAFVPGVGQLVDAAAAAAVRVVIRKAFQELIDKIAIKGATFLAERAGVEVASKLGVNAASKLALNAGKGAVVGAGLGSGTDLAAQGIEIAEGHRDGGVNWASVGTAAGAGAAAGAIAAPVGEHFTAGLAGRLGTDAQANNLGGIFTRAAGEVPGNVLGNAAASAAVSGGHLDPHALFEGAGGGLSRGGGTHPGGTRVDTPTVADTAAALTSAAGTDNAPSPTSEQPPAAPRTTEQAAPAAPPSSTTAAETTAAGVQDAPAANGSTTNDAAAPSSASSNANAAGTRAIPSDSPASPVSDATAGSGPERGTAPQTPQNTTQPPAADRSAAAAPTAAPAPKFAPTPGPSATAGPPRTPDVPQNQSAPPRADTPTPSEHRTETPRPADPQQHAAASATPERKGATPSVADHPGSRPETTSPVASRPVHSDTAHLPVDGTSANRSREQSATTPSRESRPLDASHSPEKSVAPTEPSHLPPPAQRSSSDAGASTPSRSTRTQAPEQQPSQPTSSGRPDSSPTAGERPRPSRPTERTEPTRPPADATGTAHEPDLRGPMQTSESAMGRPRHTDIPDIAGLPSENFIPPGSNSRTPDLTGLTDEQIMLADKYVADKGMPFEEVIARLRDGRLKVTRWGLTRVAVDYIRPEVLETPDVLTREYLTDQIAHKIFDPRHKRLYASVESDGFPPGCPDSQLPDHLTRTTPPHALDDAVASVDMSRAIVNLEGDGASPVWRDLHDGNAFLDARNALFRMDSRGPEMFGPGFAARDPHNLNIAKHVGQASSPDGFVSLSTSPERTIGRDPSPAGNDLERLASLGELERLPDGSYRQIRYMHELYHPYGIDVDATFHDATATNRYSGGSHQEAEILAPGGISGDTVYRIWPRELILDPQGRPVSVTVGDPIHNPAFAHLDNPRFADTHDIPTQLRPPDSAGHHPDLQQPPHTSDPDATTSRQTDTDPPADRGGRPADQALPFEVRRSVDEASGQPVSDLVVRVHLEQPAGVPDQQMRAVAETAWAAAAQISAPDHHLPWGDRPRVRVEFTIDPAHADIRATVDHTSLGERAVWSTDSSPGSLAQQLREHLGLPTDHDRVGLDATDIQHLRDRITEANTDAPLRGLTDTREVGPGKLAPLEHPGYQEYLENVLREGDHYTTWFDPRTHEAGRSVNDGGPQRPGRRNSCGDNILAGLSCFYGDPQISHPRHPDRLPDGNIDHHGPERGVIHRISDWLGADWQPYSHPDTPNGGFDDLHNLINSLGPGSSAAVAVGFHARDPQTGQPRYHSDGRPVVEEGHGVLVVYPRDADGPVWWDPLMSRASDRPFPDLVGNAGSLHAIPLTQEARPYVTHNDSQHRGSETVPGAGTGPRPGIPDLPLRPGMGDLPSAIGRGDQPGATHRPVENGARRDNRSDHRVPEPASTDRGRDLHNRDTGRDADARRPDLPAPYPAGPETHSRQPDLGRVPDAPPPGERPATTDRGLFARNRQDHPDTAASRHDDHDRGLVD